MNCFLMTLGWSAAALLLGLIIGFMAGVWSQKAASKDVKEVK